MTFLKTLFASFTLSMATVVAAQPAPLPPGPPPGWVPLHEPRTLEPGERVILDDPSGQVYLSRGGAFDLTSVPLSQVISLYFKEVSRMPYVICSDVLNDQRFVSLRAQERVLDRLMMETLLEANNLALSMKNGIAIICTKPVPVEEKPVEPSLAKEGEIFSYVPQHRSVSDLVALVSPLVDGVFANSAGATMASAVGEGGATRGSYSGGRDRDDVIVFSGDKASIARLEALLLMVDRPVSSIMVRATLYEVTDTDYSASALKLLADVLGGRVGLSMGSGSLLNSLSITTSSFEAVASIISEDSRFNVLTSPFLRVKNGHSARFQVGQDVPVATQILINPNGQTTQSSQYFPSGVIVDVRAYVRGGVIDLDLTQTVSNFVKTTFGENVNPTLNKREIQTALSLQPGEIIVLGGLSDRQDDRTNQGLFGWNFAKSKTYRNGELLLVLQADVI